MKRLILFSGGFDSTALALKVLDEEITDELYLLYFAHGNVNYKAETQSTLKVLDYLKKNYPRVKIHLVNKSLDIEPTTSDSYVRARNLIFLSHAVSFAEEYGIRDIYAGFIDNNDNYFPDASPGFVLSFSQLLNTMYGGKIIFKSPFVETDKFTLMQYVAKNFGEEILDMVVTCNVTKTLTNCGICDSCKSFNFFKQNI